MSHDFPASILVYVGLDAVGDGLLKLPFARALRHAFPAARITWLAGKGHTVYAGTLAPLVAGLLDEVIDEAGIGSRWTELLGRPLAGRSFDLIIDTQRRLLTSLILRRIPHRRFISAAAGFALSAARPPAGWVRPESMAGQMLALVELASGKPAQPHAPMPRDPATEAEAERLLPPGPRYVGLAPGAGGRHKCWPLDRFCALAAALAEQGAVPVFILGPNEADWRGLIAASVPQALFPVQDTSQPSPLLTIALGRRLKAAVANDSGTGHMLAASDIALLSLFGPTPPGKFAPSARHGRVLTAQGFGGSAMEAIPLDAVRDAVNALL